MNINKFAEIIQQNNNIPISVSKLTKNDVPIYLPNAVQKKYIYIYVNGVIGGSRYLKRCYRIGKK